MASLSRAADPSFGLLSPQGVAKTLQGPRTADMRGKLGSAFRALARRRLGAVRPRHGEEKPVLFDLAAASLTDLPFLPPSFLDRQSRRSPRDGLAGQLRAEVQRREALRSRTTSCPAPWRSGLDASGFALGTDFWCAPTTLRARSAGKRPGPGVAWGVDFSADGEILAVAYGDGTIRWLRWSDGAELLAFFVEPQSRKWVAWTPTGYYMASAGGEDLIGWHVNRGWAQEADFFPASQFRAEYNRPDIVKLVLEDA